jgi:TetR/AcrR family transcriptional regulator, regulator of cefoperazone and chloramphenicol sensitivity
MTNALEKAKKDPDSMKAKVLSAARKLFGEYGYHGTTTRMIAKEVGIDVSTLYYHWGEKKDLFESVIIDLQNDYRTIVKEIEGEARDKPLYDRYAVAIDRMCDFLSSHPEGPNLRLFLLFGKTKQKFETEMISPSPLEEMAQAMGFRMEDREFSNKVKAGVLAVWFSVFSFFAGEHQIRPLFNMEPEEYLKMVKETMKRILIPGYGSKGRKH